MKIPDADVISTAEPETDEWFAERRTGITATDLPKILGLSRYGTALHVYHDKRGDLPPDPGGPAARWGHLLEDIIATTWAADHGWTVERVGVLANREHPHRRAALDRLVHGCPAGPCAVEVKNRSAYVAGKWREEIPDDVHAQVAWQRLVSGLDHIHVAVLIGGNDLREHTYDRDDELEAFLIREAEAVWACVQNGTPPATDVSDLLVDLLNRLYPNRSGAAVLDPDDVAKIRADYLDAHATEAAGKAGKTWAGYRLVSLLGGADTAAIPGPDGESVPVATYRGRRHTTTDLERLKREFPDAYKACVRTGLTEPFITWKRD